MIWTIIPIGALSAVLVQAAYRVARDYDFEGIQDWDEIILNTLWFTAGVTTAVVHVMLRGF